MKKLVLPIFVISIVLILSTGIMAENYVNWKAGFWLSFPDSWSKVDYKLADRIFSYSDTSRHIFFYEAVFAPTKDKYLNDAYIVITFDSTGELSKKEADSLINDIASSYAEQVYGSRVVQRMSDLVPGRPQVSLKDHTISVMIDMAYSPESKMKNWNFMKLSKTGLINLYCYSPDSSFNRNMPVFEEIVKSLSFDNLRDAAGDQELKFTDIGASIGDNKSIISEAEKEAAEPVNKFKNWILIAVVLIIAFGLIWNFIIQPRIKKKDL